MSQRHVAISLTEGRTVRDLFYNGLLDHFAEAGYGITLFTEALNVPAFTEEFSYPYLEFAPLHPIGSSSWATRAFWVRRWLSRRTNGSLLNRFLQWEERRYYPSEADYVAAFKAKRPDLLLTTHAHLPREAPLLTAAHELRIPTLGIVRSWDNVYKGIRSRPQQLAVWNTVNRDELLELEGYRPEQVHIIGSPQFDAYFDPDGVWSRDQIAAHYNLDPSRPIILFATLGYFFPGFDETVWMDVLLDLLDSGELDGDPQIICRLHPWSRYEHFQKYADHPQVRLSYIDRYWPALTWYMTRADVIAIGNTLRHADVVITPGSTMSLEAAIFDTPTLVPIFHRYQVERARNYFATWVLGKHFGRIERLDLVPILRNESEFAPAINRCLAEPDWYQAKRKQLVDEYVHFTDGQATRRLFELAQQVIQQQ